MVFRKAKKTFLAAALLLIPMIGYLLGSCATMSSWTSIADSRTPIGKIPKRPTNAMTGSQFVRLARTKSVDAREALVFEQLRLGNIPNFLRQTRPIELRLGASKATAYVMPDYLAIGSDADFIRIPMTPVTAQRIADLYGYLLPTRKLVNDIYRQAAVKLRPAPMTPGRLMTSTAYYEQHNRTIERQAGAKKRGQLIAGHKKDIVITNLLRKKPMRVAIYGWHRGIGNVIQPLSTVHGNNYADYSHGVRLVLATMKVDGRTMRVGDVLNNRKLAALLSDEGMIPEYRVRMNYMRPIASL